MGRIEKLQLLTGKGQPPLPVNSVEAIAGLGLKGDRFCDGSPRQISLLDASVRSWMDRQETEGLCFRRYKGNLLLSDCNIGSLKPGELCQAGKAVLRITETDKECFPECPRRQKGLKCQLPGGCGYAEVAEGGEISLGDAFFVI